jgi:N4-gp56 family major capsid protein
MLKTLMFSLRMYQFADRKTAPAQGTLAIRFFRARKAKKAAGGQGPQNLTEGVVVQHKTEVSVGNLDCYLNQRGDDFEISDIVRATDVLDTLKVYMKTVGEDAALDFDQVMTNSIMGNATTANLAKALGLGAAQTTLYNSNAAYGVATAKYFERFAGIVNTGNSGNDFASLLGETPANSKFTRLEHLRALTQLRANDVKPPDGKVFPVIVAPQVKFDIRQDSTLVAAMTQRDNAKLYKWEEFELDGGAFIESTNPWQESQASGYGTYDNTGTVFTSMYLGDDAYGTVRISTNVAGGDPAAPKITVLDEPDKSDPYNQKVIGAWKAYYGSILKITSDATDVPHVVALRTQSSFQ